MYITEIELSNIRSISRARWTVPKESCAGWHVIIGDNGAGKSTFLRSVALALIGPAEAGALRQDWNQWLARSRSRGHVSLRLFCDWSKDGWSGSGNPPVHPHLPVKLTLSRIDEEVRLSSDATAKPKPERHVWGSGGGWFSASYGPFRRFAGGDKDYEKVYYSNPRLAPHLSVFGESVALSECLRWLQELQFKSLEGSSEAKTLLGLVTRFVNQDGFLPHHAKLHSVSSKEVTFVDGNEYRLPVEELSDGYRSVLSMTFELIRQLARAYGAQSIFEPAGEALRVNSPGVVLIDEADVHLHPTWQRQIGLWLRQHFPIIQFIVTTHSPLICQAADVGTVWRLPKPGSNESGRMITGIELERLVYGNVLDAYGTELFGSGVTRSDQSVAKLNRLAELNVKESQAELSPAEREEQAALRAALPTSAYQTEAEVNR